MRKRHFAILAPLFVAATQLCATTYYVSPTGNDSNAGTSLATAWATLANVKTRCTTAGGFAPDDAIRLQRGGKWRDELICGFALNTVAGDTLASKPPRFSGSSGHPITIGNYGMGAEPIIDAADPISTVGSISLGGGVFTIPGPAAGMPAKLYMDGENTVTTQLSPQPNAVGEYSATTTYNPLDLVTMGIYSGTYPNYYVHGTDGPTTGVSPQGGMSNAWTTDITNGALFGCTDQCFATSFSTTNTGPQNVAANPGSWWADSVNNLIYIQLPDGSNPANHTITGTYRNTNITLRDANWITISGIQGAHAQKQGFVCFAYSDSQGGSYPTCENNTYAYNKIWNWGDISSDNTYLQSGTSVKMSLIECALCFHADFGSTAHLLAGDKTTRNWVLTNDSYIGLRGGAATYTAGIYLLGLDGGGTANNLVADHNLIRTINSRGMVFNTDTLSGGVLNNGGGIAWNEFVNNQGNLFFGFMRYGRVYDNLCRDSYGQCIQLGGNSVGPYLIDHNVLANNAEDYQKVDYNLIDGNGGCPNGEFSSNTLFNPWGSAVTQEIGCPGGNIHDNIIATKYNLFPSFSTGSGSNAYYYNINSYTGGYQASHNYFFLTTSVPHPFQIAGTGGTAYTTAQYNASWPDSTSVFGGDPQFVNPETKPAMKSKVSYKLLTTSPAYKVGTGGKPAGAYDNTADAFDETLVGPTAPVGKIYGKVTSKVF